MTDRIKYRRGVILVRAESTYGTDPFSGTPSFGSGYELYVENWESDIEYEPIVREGLQPHRQQLLPAQGAGTFPLRFDCEVSPFTVVDANSRPKIGPLLGAAGLAPTASVAGDPKTITYKDTDYGQESVTVYALLYNESADDGIMVIYTGCRFNWRLVAAPKERWLISFEGNAAAGAESDVGAGPSASIAYQLPRPLNGGGAVCSLVELGADTSYSLGLVRAEFSGNTNPTEVLELTGDGGIGEVALPGSGHLTAQVVIRTTVRGTFDPALYQRQVTPLVLSIGQPNPASAGNYVSIGCTTVIQTRPMESGDAELANWNLGLALISPESGGDGGGLVPVNGVFSLVFGTKS